MWLSPGAGEQRFCWADFNLQQQRRKWELILLRELTAVYCTLQTLPGESVAKFVLSNVRTWFMFCNREVKGCLSSFILTTWEFESPSPPQWSCCDVVESVVVVSFFFPRSTTVRTHAMIRVKTHGKHACSLIMKLDSECLCQPVYMEIFISNR